MRVLKPGSVPLITLGAVAGRAGRFAIGFGFAALLTGCATPPSAHLARNENARVYDPKLGVWSSPRLVADGEAVPRGGGSYLTGRPYMIGGRTYVPSQNPAGYSVVGTASWYGDAFHGRRTANGEIFDKGSISAAHPTLPLPSYVRVTNLKNGRSMIVRVNDRGPYHGGRVMDVSQRVADALEFRGEGTARIRVDYLGRAGLGGSDDARLLASLRTDGGPAQLDGLPDEIPTMTADAAPPSDKPDPTPPPLTAATALSSMDRPDDDTPVTPVVARHLSVVPVPPARPFSLGEVDPALLPPSRSRGGKAPTGGTQRQALNDVIAAQVLGGVPRPQDVRRRRPADLGVDTAAR